MPLVDAPSLSYGRLVANVLAGAAGRAAAIATALVLSTVLVRTLGLAAYGTWSFFFVLIGYQGQFDLGLSVAVERAVARAAVAGDRARIDILLNTGVALTLGVAVVCSWSPCCRSRTTGSRASATRPRCGAACWCSPSAWPAAMSPRWQAPD